MSEEKRKYSKRTLVDFNRILSVAGQDIIVCIPKSVLHIARELAGDRGNWLTSYFIDDLGDRYTIPDDIAFAPIRDDLARFYSQTEEEIYMCNDLLISTLESLRTAIINTSCCGTSGPQGVIESDGEYFFGTEQPISVPIGTVPSGFADEAEYDSHRCDVANLIIENLIGTLNNLATLTLAQLTAAGIAAGFIVGILNVAGVLVVAIAFALTGAAFALLSSLASYIDTNRQEFVCALYDSPVVTFTYNTLRDLIIGAASAIGATTTEIELIADIVMSLVNIDVLNNLHTAIGLPSAVNPVDCSGCGECQYLNTVAVVSPIYVDSGSINHWEAQIDATDFGAQSRGCCFNVVSVSVGSYGQYTFPSLIEFNCGNPNSGAAQADNNVSVDWRNLANWSGETLEYVRLKQLNNSPVTITVEWV